jgi:uncharacterized protein
MSRRQYSRKRDRRQAVQDTTTAPAAPQVIPMAEQVAYNAMVVMGQPSRTTDAFSNAAARLGHGTQSLMNGTDYPLTRLTQNYALLNSLYRTNWIVKNIIDTYPEDMLKAWVKVITQVEPERLDQLTRAMRQARLRPCLEKGLRYGRLYGGAGGLMLIKGHEKLLEEPLDLNSVLPDSFRGLHIIDRWSGIYPTGQLVGDISDPDYGLPEYYSIRDDTDRTVANVHHSRVIRFTGADLPHWESIAEMQWGASEIEAVYDDIVRRDNVAANIANLTFRANVTTIEMDGLDQLFGIGGAMAQQRFWQMMQAQSIALSNNGIQLVNKGDKFDTHQYSFSGLADVYSTIQMDVSGATGIPVTKLFGRSPAGLNATGEGDMENYYGRVEQKQESDLRPALDKIMPVLCMSTWGEVPDDLEYTFNPIRTPKTKEMADTVKAKSTAIIETFEKGIIDQGTAQKELRELAKETGMFSNVTDAMIESGLDKWVWQLGAIDDPFKGIRPKTPNPEDGEEDLLDE